MKGKPTNMPKLKIEVNENLNVSIGELLKITEERSIQNSIPIEISKNMVPERSSIPEKDVKTNNLNTDIRRMIPKIGKVSLQHQRSGRGGKTVTLITIGEASYEIKQNLEALLKELKKSLGCGGQIEEGKIVLQGEIAGRASEWFIKMGAKAVKSS
jgi:translation initiation factor 1